MRPIDYNGHVPGEGSRDPRDDLARHLRQTKAWAVAGLIVCLSVIAWASLGLAGVIR